MNACETNLVWMDLEMSGLDPSRDVILEASVIITDENLNVLDEGRSFIVYQDEGVYSRMDEWNQTHHSQSGLWQAVRTSHHSIGEVETKILDYIKDYTVPSKAILCGNSIGQDRRFIRKYMPRLDSFLHYRMIDVSSIKELVKRWYKLEFKKDGQRHRALDDIKESIEELKFYRSKVFVPVK